MIFSGKNIKVDEWHEMYLTPFLDADSLDTAICSHGGFDGWVLDGVLAALDIYGDEATDGECLELVRLLLDEWASKKREIQWG